MNRKYFSMFLIVAPLLIGITVGASAAPVEGPIGATDIDGDLPHPLKDQQLALGKITKDERKVKPGSGNDM